MSPSCSVFPCSVVCRGIARPRPPVLSVGGGHARHHCMNWSSESDRRRAPARHPVSWRSIELTSNRVAARSDSRSGKRVITWQEDDSKWGGVVMSCDRVNRCSSKCDPSRLSARLDRTARSELRLNDASSPHHQISSSRKGRLVRQRNELVCITRDDRESTIPPILLRLRQSLLGR